MVGHAREVAGKVFGRGVPLLRVLRQATIEDPAHGRGSLRRCLGERLRLLTDYRHERLGARLSLERAFARGHLVKDRAEGKLVGPEVHELSARLFGRHVAGRPHHGSGLGRRRDRGRQRGGVVRHGLGQLGEAEVEDLDVPVLRDHQVLGL